MDLPYPIAQQQAHALPPKPPGGKALKRLDEFLLARAMTEIARGSNRACVNCGKSSAR